MYLATSGIRSCFSNVLKISSDPNSKLFVARDTSRLCGKKRGDNLVETSVSREKLARERWKDDRSCARWSQIDRYSISRNWRVGLQRRERESRWKFAFSFAGLSAVRFDLCRLSLYAAKAFYNAYRNHLYCNFYIHTCVSKNYSFRKYFNFNFIKSIVWKTSMCSCLLHIL